MDALINLFYDPAPKDTVGFYNQIYAARDNQYIVLRLDKAQSNNDNESPVVCSVQIYYPKYLLLSSPFEEVEGEFIDDEPADDWDFDGGQ